MKRSKVVREFENEREVKKYELITISSQIQDRTEMLRITLALFIKMINLLTKRYDGNKCDN